MTDHTNCCCTETLNDHLALQAAYGAACRDRDELEERLLEALAERDRARALAARLEAEAAQPRRETIAAALQAARAARGAGDRAEQEIRDRRAS